MIMLKGRLKNAILWIVQVATNGVVYIYMLRIRKFEGVIAKVKV